MKKIFILGAFALATLALTSCDPNKEQCWKLTIGYPTGQTEVHYFYGTGIEADAQLEVYHRAGANSVDRKQAFLSKDNCHK